jgi:hypothetical protein
MSVNSDGPCRPPHEAERGDDLRAMLSQFALPGEECFPARDLPLIHRFNRTADPDGATLVLLHGTGGSEADLMPPARRLRPAVRASMSVSWRLVMRLLLQIPRKRLNGCCNDEGMNCARRRRAGFGLKAARPGSTVIRPRSPGWPLRASAVPSHLL